MSSVGITSTNDVSSTAAVSDTRGSFSTDAAQHVTHALTTDAIIRECIKQGFYRNPICNEKLYLHNRGFDSVAPTAFEPYTDVKVLWLEGNGFSSLPCGAGYTQVQPPIRVDPFQEVTERDVKDGCAEQNEHHVDPSTLGTAPAIDKPLPLPADVPPEERDAFSSLYPTVRQLYLHNNVFSIMPDLSRFQRLDSVNLSGNFISTIAPHCVFWDKKTAERDAKAEKEEQPQQRTESQERQHPAAPESVMVVSSATDAKAQREAQLEAYRRRADECAILCEHCPLPEREEEAPALDAHEQPLVSTSYVPRQPPLPEPEYRNTCSSLRNLNMAGNRLETFEDCLGLLSYKALAVLDLSHNHIVDGEALLLILERLPRLQSLKLSGNPLVRTLPRYRKRLLSRCKTLLYLDDRPVFPEERRLVTAWSRGGDDGEEKERLLIKQEKAAAEKKRLDDFRRFISQHHTEMAGEAPHKDYVRAVTTSAALSAAAGTADTTVTTTTTASRNVVRSHRPSRRSHRGGLADRRPSSDPDNSPTSSDSVDSDEVHYEEELFPSRHGDAAAAGGAEIERNEGTASHEITPAQENTNKPVGDGAAREYKPRVLSSNQRVTLDAANHDDNADDIFVPES